MNVCSPTPVRTPHQHREISCFFSRGGENKSKSSFCPGHFILFLQMNSQEACTGSLPYSARHVSLGIVGYLTDTVVAGMTVFELMEDEKEEGGEEGERRDGREGGGEKVNQSFQPLSSTVVNTPLIQ